MIAIRRLVIVSTNGDMSKMRELWRYIWTRTNVVLFVFGTMFLLIGVYLAPPFGGQQLSLAGRFTRLFEPVGYSILVTTLVFSCVNYE